ncbi:MAG: hypothetical protein NW208_08275 [Bryobacter sp.]|nr:hypothetical protein [Bryobacter sp.]
MGAEIGIQIAILSIREQAGNILIHVFRPNATPEFEAWLEKIGGVQLSREPLPDANDWNCKPQALLNLLDRGASEAIWFDSDLMTTGNFLGLWDAADSQTLVVTQEAKSMADQGTAVRTEAWGFPVGRRISFTLNSCFLRVTEEHRNFLNTWKECLSSPDYTEASKRTVEERPMHMKGDQDVLNALLGSKQFAGIPLRVIRSGEEIIHCGGALGYSPLERVRTAFRRPYFFHAIAGKPWVLLSPKHFQPGWFGWYRRLLQELSPYVLECRRRRTWFPQVPYWLQYQTPLGYLLRLCSFEHYAWAGFFPAVVAVFLEQARKLKP